MTRQPGLPAYDGADKFPPRVWKAVEITRSQDFPLACIPEVGRLLQICAGLHGVEKVCELGTAYGVGAAWIESGLRPGATLLTVELDAERAAAARALMSDNQSVEVLTGDWSLARSRGPFDLLFSDGGPKRDLGDPEKIAQLLRAGGLVLLDDYTPESAWTESQRAIYAADFSRKIWLESPLYRAQELVVNPASSVIFAVRTA